jgi:hypothetical protein
VRASRGADQEEGAVTNKQAVIGRSLATLIAVTMVPGIARADAMSDMRAQLDALTGAMKQMQAHQAELEKRLAESEAARTAQARSAQAAPPQAAPVGAGQGQPDQLAASRAANGISPAAPPPSQPIPPEQVARADVTAAPPGTIAPNPYFRNNPKTPGKGASFLIPGLDTTIRIGGLIKVDAFDDLSGANLNGWPTDGVSIPLKGTTQADRKHSFSMTARQTRFNIGSETPTKFGALRAFLEGDFYGTGGTALLTNSAALRLRHAYISLGDFTVGQTWSTFFDLEAAPETLDMTGPVGNAYAIRQPLVRYQMGFGKHSQLTVSLENPEGDFLGADHTSNIPVGSTLSTRVLNQAPDFAARYTWKDDRFRISAAGVARYINLDTGGASLPFVDRGGAFNYAGKASTWAFGGQIDAKLKTFGEDSFALQANGGPGIGRYMMIPQDEAFAIGVAPNGAVNANPGNGAVLGRDGKLRTILTYGASAWYRHYWTKTIRSNLTVAYEHMGTADSTTPINYPDKLTTIHANLIWSPLPQLGFGVEYVRGYLGLHGQTDANRLAGIGDHGVMNRIQFSAQYNLF